MVEKEHWRGGKMPVSGSRQLGELPRETGKSGPSYHRGLGGNGLFRSGYGICIDSKGTVFL